MPEQDEPFDSITAVKLGEPDSKRWHIAVTGRGKRGYKSAQPDQTFLEALGDAAEDLNAKLKKAEAPAA